MHSSAKLSFISVALALALGATSATAQTSSGSSGSSGGMGSGATGGATGSGSSTASGLSSEDRDMIEDLAEANLAEIETGRLALSKSQNPRVREFAQKMIDDHSTAQQELQQMAQAKGMTLPQETDLAHRTVAGALRLLSGETFESQYINRVGMDDHQRTVELLQKAQGQAKDTDLKAMAGRMLPVVQGHLDMARQMSQQGEQQGSQSQGSSGSSGMGGSTGGSMGGSSGGGMGGSSGGASDGTTGSGTGSGTR